MSEPTQETVHRPVMPAEVLHYLDLKPGLVVVDGTVGAGGHSRLILERIEHHGKLIGLDRDAGMLRRAAAQLSAPNCYLRHASYADLPQVLDELGLDTVDRVLLDLGLSSDQLADPVRGFGFQTHGSLDMRFDESRGEPAWQRLETVDEKELEDVLRRFGEERYSRRIAREIITHRGQHPIRTTDDLVQAVSRALPRSVIGTARKHPATRVFQALRIWVNQELSQLEIAIGEHIYKRLAPGGRAVVISFHSLEDRLVKQAFRNRERWESLTTKPVTASSAEQRINPRSRTAKLRAARKI